MSISNKLSVSIVILAHNEADIIENVVKEFYKKIITKIPKSELIVAEDGSTDGTKEILRNLSKSMRQLKWLEGKKKLGYVSAFKKAMLAPKNELILFCDCSGKHDPNDFWKMLDLIDTNDMVIGYKEKRQDPIYRIYLAKIFNLLVRLYFKVPFNDIDCPLRLIRKTPMKKIFKQKWVEESLINFELTLRFYFSGFKVTEVPVKHFKRLNGESRGLPLKKIPKVIIKVLKNFPKLKNELINKEKI